MTAPDKRKLVNRPVFRTSEDKLLVKEVIRAKEALAKQAVENDETFWVEG